MNKNFKYPKVATPEESKEVSLKREVLSNQGKGRNLQSARRQYDSKKNN